MNGFKHNNTPSNLWWADRRVQTSNKEMSVPILQVDVQNREVLARYATIANAAEAVSRTKEAVRVASLEPSKTCAGFKWIRA
jgi:hypothetical protein